MRKCALFKTKGNHLCATGKASVGQLPPPPSKLPSSSNGARCFRCAVQSSRLFSMVHVYVTSPSIPHNHQRFENVSDRRQRMAPKGEWCFGTTLHVFHGGRADIGDFNNKRAVGMASVARKVSPPRHMYALTLSTLLFLFASVFPWRRTCFANGSSLSHQQTYIYYAPMSTVLLSSGEPPHNQHARGDLHPLGQSGTASYEMRVPAAPPLADTASSIHPTE